MEIEIKEYEGAGYSPIITYDRWRVAVANYAEKFHPDNFSYMERHLQTDEVFILLQGIATLFIGEDKKEYPLQPCKLYNVKKGAWHNIVLSKDAKILIIENDDTGKENTEYWYFK